MSIEKKIENILNEQELSRTDRRNVQDIINSIQEVLDVMKAKSTEWTDPSMEDFIAHRMIAVRKIRSSLVKFMMGENAVMEPVHDPAPTVEGPADERQKLQEFVESIKKEFPTTKWKWTPNLHIVIGPEDTRHPVSKQDILHILKQVGVKPQDEVSWPSNFGDGEEYFFVYKGREGVFNADDNTIDFSS